MTIVFLAVFEASTCTAQPRLVGAPCEGCEAVHEYRDVADRPLTPVDTLPGFDAARQKMLLRGRIFMPDGETPASGVILYVHHTNEVGEYATLGDEFGWGRRHGYIRGWIRT
ncbi:MAG: intradiol ring-cleavage dioxygenase, partial [Rhodothermales bacterium]|nr:intradiol ring-cleavage dioxygenase [Rhodothermales bacterium]